MSGLFLCLKAWITFCHEKCADPYICTMKVGIKLDTPSTVLTVVKSASNDDPTPETSQLCHRDELMITRYYFYRHLYGLSYTKSIELLEKDIFLKGESAYLYRKIYQNAARIEELISNEVKLRDIKKLYPNFNWSAWWV